MWGVAGKLSVTKDGQGRGTCFPPEKEQALSGIRAKCVQCLRPSQLERGTEEAELGKVGSQVADNLNARRLLRLSPA